MFVLPEALQGLARYKQFCIYKKAPSRTRPGKVDKFPCDLAGQVRDAHDPAIWLDADTALATAQLYGEPYGVGFTFTEQDPFYFFDIDDCAINGKWSARAMELLSRFAGAAVEISQSGTGLHIIGTGCPAVEPQDRRKKATTGDFDLYTEGRFVALTGTSTLGSVDHQVDQAQLDYVVDQYLAKQTAAGPVEWQEGPVDEWDGPTDDAELIAKALASRSAAGAFSADAVSFRDLWEANPDVLGRRWPDDHQGRDFDASQADSALAQHLAFWTGKDCPRIERLMRGSALYREKWDDRGDYLYRTITGVIALQRDVYRATRVVDTTAADGFGACKLRGSDAQVQYAASIRAEKLAAATQEQGERLGLVSSSKFWIENKHLDATALAQMVTPVEHADAPGVRSAPELVSGYQYLGPTQQLELFKGCVYVQSVHKIFTPTGQLLNDARFKATYGGYVFQLDDSGEKTTRNAWEAFTESQIIRHPRAEKTCFRPTEETGAILDDGGTSMVNTYVEIKTPRVKGDPTPFVRHLGQLLPDPRDRQILLNYMAAVVQYKGVKFQWAPLLQGVEGNGKTLFTRCVAYAIGERYTHLPPSEHITEKFNEWLFNRIFIGVEDVYVPEHKREMLQTLLPMITNERLSKRGMQASQVMDDCVANFILNTNPKEALRKTRNDRRLAVFYTAQQNEADLRRDGMDGDYFPDLYAWLKGSGKYQHLGPDYGYAVVNEYLATYAIAEEFNPAGAAHRAPITSTTEEAIAAGMGSIEQEIVEAVGEARIGFAGGWISSVALDNMLQAARAQKQVPRNRRRELLKSLGYDYHPALQDGRVTQNTAYDGGKRPRLFIRDGHISGNLRTPTEVVKAYESAQADSPHADANQVFSTA